MAKLATPTQQTENTIKHWYSILDRLSAPRVFLYSFIAIGVVPSLISILEGNAFFSERLPDFPFFGKFIVWPIAYLIIFPVLNTFCYLFYKSSRATLMTAIRDGTISCGPEKFESLRTILCVPHPLWKLFGLSLLSAFFAVGYWLGFLKMLKLNTWCYGSVFDFSILFYVSLVIWFTEALIILLMIWDFSLWISVENRIVQGKDAIEFSPSLLHPDKTAGLAGFGKTASMIYYIIFSLLVFVSIQIIEKYISDPGISLIEIIEKYRGVPFSFLALLFILPFSFLLPLTPFYRRLRNQKREFLRKINLILREKLPIYQRDFLQIPSNKDTSMAEQLAEFEAICKVYTYVKKIPLLPFDLATSRKIFISFVIPILLFVLDYLRS